MEPSDRNLFQSVIKMVDSLSATGNYDTIINILSLLCLLSVLNRSPNTAALSGGGSPFSALLGELMNGTNSAAANNVNNSANNSPLAGILGELLKGGNGSMNGNTGNNASPLGGILGELLKGGGSNNNNVSANPLGNILGELLKGSSGGNNNSNNTNPLGGFLSSALSSPDLLMSLLPLLGGLQNKAKSNNGPNIASVMGILNNLSGLGINNNAPSNNTQAANNNKNTANKAAVNDLKPAQPEPVEKKTLNEEAAPEIPPSPTPPESSLPAPVMPEVIPFKKEQIMEPLEGKSTSRFLKWKTNF